ncbi:MAG: hypothetical protein L6Q71_04110, partial [Planctomycetes bacterium]|nr:hypothetical protein [Planctomycetota bacterium]
NSLNKPMAQPATTFDQLARDFEIAWYEALLEQTPDNLIAMEQLAHAYTAAGRYKDGLAMDKKLVAAMPEAPLVHYNLACSLSLTGDLDGAIDELLVAIKLGYEDFDHLMQDDDLEAARNHVRFEEVIVAAENVDKGDKPENREEDF